MKKRQSNIPNSIETNCENIINRQVVMVMIKKFQKVVDLLKKKKKSKIEKSNVH